VVEDRPARAPEVLLVAVAVVAVVAVAVVLTGLLPEVAAVVYETPLAIAVLIGGTGWVLWRISRNPRS